MVAQHFTQCFVQQVGSCMIARCRHTYCAVYLCGHCFPGIYCAAYYTVMHIFAVRQFFCMVYHNFTGSAANHTMIPCLTAAHSIERSNRQYYIYFLAFFGLCHFLTVYNHAGQSSFYTKLCVAYKFCSV